MFFQIFLIFAFSSLPLVLGRAKALDLMPAASLVEEYLPNYCNDTELAQLHGLHRTALGQFVGYGCSADFFHCRWQSDGFRTYKKSCRVGLVFDTDGTQNCNYDYNVKGCAIKAAPAKCKNATDFACPLSEKCVTLSQRCDGVYDCVLEEDEQNCPMCRASEFACVVSEQCIPMTARCNGQRDCGDGTDELDCDVCGPEKFYCRKSRKCIPSVERCDGRSQCPGGEDEHLCKKESNGMYLCENRQSQVERNLVCDGKEDCPDGSDEKYCLEAGRGGPETPDSSLESNLITEGPINPVAASVLPSGAVPADHPPGYGVEMPSAASAATGSLPSGLESEKAAEFPRIRFEASPNAETIVERIPAEGADGFGSVTEFGVAPGAVAETVEAPSVQNPIPAVEQHPYAEVPPQPNGYPEKIPTEPNSAERWDAEERRQSAEAANRASELLRVEAAHREAQRTEAAHKAAEAAHREALRAEAAQRSAELQKSREAAQRSAELLRAAEEAHREAEAAHRSAELQRSAEIQKSMEAAQIPVQSHRITELSAETPNRSAETQKSHPTSYLVAASAPQPQTPPRPRRPSPPKPSERRPNAAKSRESTESHRGAKTHPTEAHRSHAAALKHSHYPRSQSQSRETSSAAAADTSGPKSGLHLKSKSYRSADHPDPSPIPYSTAAPLQPLPLGATPLQNLPLIAVPMASAGFPAGGHVAGYAAAVHPLTFTHPGALQPILFVPDCANYGPCPQQMRGNSAESRNDQRNSGNSGGSAQFEVEEPTGTRAPVAVTEQNREVPVAGLEPSRGPLETPEPSRSQPEALEQNRSQPEAQQQSRSQPHALESIKSPQNEIESPSPPPQPSQRRIPSIPAIPSAPPASRPQPPKPKPQKPKSPKSQPTGSTQIPTFVGQPGRRDFSQTPSPQQPPKPMESQLNPQNNDFGSIHGPNPAAPQPESAEQSNVAHDQPEMAASEELNSPAAEEPNGNEIYAAESNPEEPQTTSSIAAEPIAEPNAAATQSPAEETLSGDSNSPQNYPPTEEQSQLPEAETAAEPQNQPYSPPESQNHPYSAAEAQNPAENPPEYPNSADAPMESPNVAEFAPDSPPAPIQMPPQPPPKPRPQPRIPASLPKPNQRPNMLPLSSRSLPATPSPRRPAIGGAWATYAQHPITRPPPSATAPPPDEAAALAELARRVGANKGATYGAVLRRIEQILRSEAPPPSGNDATATVAEPRPLQAPAGFAVPKKSADLSKKIVAEPLSVPIVDSRPAKAGHPPKSMGSMIRATTPQSLPAELEALKRPRVTKMIRVTAHPHRWHPSLSTNSPSRPDTATASTSGGGDSGDSPAVVAVVRRRHSPRPSQRLAADRRSFS